MKEIGPIAGTDHKITMKKLCPIAGIDCKKTMTKINHAEGTDCQSITEIIMKEMYYNTFEDHGNRRKYKDHYKDKYRDKNFYDRDRSYDTDNSQGRDRA